MWTGKWNAYSHDRNTGVLNLLDHLRGRIVGDKHHLWMNCQQAFDVHAGEIARCRQCSNRRHKARKFRPELFFPARHHANNVLLRIELDQNIQRLVLQHDHFVHMVRNRDLSTKLISDRSVSLSRKRKQHAGAYQHKRAES